jgi:hypothetical protein
LIGIKAINAAQIGWSMTNIIFGPRTSMNVQHWLETSR